VDNNAEFDRDLPRDAVRPFLCDGSPFGCKVFVVGVNPGTDIPLWPYWSVERGCDKKGWLQAYLAKHNRLRPTRKRLERLYETLAPVRALETNVFNQFSRRETDLGTEQRSTEVFDVLSEFLLPRLEPHVVFVHGGSAIRHLERLTSTKIIRGEFIRVCYKGVAFEVRARDHLSYQCSMKEVEELGRELRDRCLR
jgi:hypothetical protein